MTDIGGRDDWIRTSGLLLPKQAPYANWATSRASDDDDEERMERSTGIEPAFRAWEARVLPLDDDRMHVGMTLATMERVTGIEPALAAWKAEVLPLDDTRERIARNRASNPSLHATAHGT
jgi:hypothetical protein